MRTAYTHGYTQSSSTRRTGWTAGDKGGEQEARMCRVFNLMRQAKPMHTIIINTPLHRFHTHTRHMEANKKPYCDSTGLKMIW